LTGAGVDHGEVERSFDTGIWQTSRVVLRHRVVGTLHTAQVARIRRRGSHKPHHLTVRPATRPANARQELQLRVQERHTERYRKIISRGPRPRQAKIDRGHTELLDHIGPPTVRDGEQSTTLLGGWYATAFRRTVPPR
jgi:hypothetical protein